MTKVKIHYDVHPTSRTMDTIHDGEYFLCASGKLWLRLQNVPLTSGGAMVAAVRLDDFLVQHFYWSDRVRPVKEVLITATPEDVP